jgi:hypothetical protein
MMRAVVLAVLVALTFVSVSFRSPADWLQFKSDGYSVLFPVKPTSDIKTIPSELGELKMNINMYDASKSGKKDDNLVYMSMSTEYPESAIKSDMKEKLPILFRNAVDGSVKSVNGKLMSEKEIEIDGYPGREIKVDFKDGLAIINARYYLVKNRMYVVQTITFTDRFPNESQGRFISSFRLQSAH